MASYNREVYTLTGENTNFIKLLFVTQLPLNLLQSNVSKKVNEDLQSQIALR